MSEVSKLKIVGYKDTTSSSKLGEFEVQLNPVDISVVRSVDKPKDELNSDGVPSSQQTEIFRPAKFTFKFTIDNSGAINIDLPKKATSISESIKVLEELTIIPDNTTHKQPYVVLYWGNTFQDSYFGRVTALKYDYNFFDMFGDPLRANITLTITEENAVFDRSFQSPDITKLIEVKDKDNIVKFSLDSYDDKKYYIRIAEINNLSSLRGLKNGSSILLPPIEK